MNIRNSLEKRIRGWLPKESESPNVFRALAQNSSLLIISVAVFGAVLIVIGSLFLVLGKRNMPELPMEARVLLKEINRR